MENEFENLSGDEKLKAENEFLKMKMMLEIGAQFGGGNANLPPEIENKFLNHILAFEKQSSNPVYIKLYDKFKRPTQFKPVTEISDDDIEGAWEVLSSFMNSFGVNLHVCSPNITARELYRFTTEELFNEKTDDMQLPGMMRCFTYDEFYPDPYYECPMNATNECIKFILEKEPMEWTVHFSYEKIRLNDHADLNHDELKAIVNRFKLAYENLEIVAIKDTECVVNGEHCRVTGNYEIIASTTLEKITLAGNWAVNFEREHDLGYWVIVAVDIEGIKF